MIIVSKEAEIKILKQAQNPGQGYGSWGRTNEGGEVYHERQPGSGGTSPWSRVDNDIRERVQPYKDVQEEGMKDEWGEDHGVKPSGTELKKKKRKIRRRKNRKKKDLGYITEFERINRSDPKFIGRVQKHQRRMNDYSPGKTPPGRRGGWANYREIWPKLPSWEPETWEERTNRDMYL